MNIHFIEDSELKKVVTAIKEKNGIETFNGADMAKEVKKQPLMKLFIDGGIDTDKLYEFTEDDFEGLTYVQSYAFYGMRWIKKIILPETVTGYNNNCFNDCLNLEEIHLPSVWISTGNQGFNDCNKLKKINVENFTSVGENGFRRCYEMEKFDFHKLTSISSQGFYGCTKLVTLIIRRSSVCKLSNTNALTNTPIASGTGFVYVPLSLIEDYKTATNWTTYAAQLRAIEDYPEICGGVSE